MTNILAAQRNRNLELIPARAFRRSDRVFLPGIDRHRQTRQHPVKTAQHRRFYRATTTEFGSRPHSYQPDDRVYLIDRQAPRKRVPGLNCPSEGETWAEFNRWRNAYGLDIIKPW